MTPAGRLIIIAACGAVWSSGSRGASSALYRDCRNYDNSTWFGGEVCGSDGITYPNSQYLQCLNYQQPGRRVSVRHSGPCNWTQRPCAFTPYYTPVCGSDGRTYANADALTCKRLLDPHGQVVQMLHGGRCYRQRLCRWEGGRRTPVCASNGFTYSGVEDVACLRSMGTGVYVRHEGGCSVDEVRAIIGSQYHACLVMRTHAEWNPVCASGGITYPSAMLLFCRRPDEWSWLPGECGSELHASCKRAAYDRDCAPGPPSRPVCGTDGENYVSEDELHCAARCNKYLQVKHFGRCQSQDDPCLRNSDLADGGTPVCGSDAVSYVNSEALWCFRRRHKPYLAYLHDGPCLQSSGSFY